MSDFKKLINASDLIEWIMETYPDWCVGVVRSIVDHINGMSPAQPEPMWIPVSERLPENEYVLISKKPTKISGSKWSVAIAIRTADPRSGKIQWRDSGFGVIEDDKVLAWMPRPKPYKEEQGGDQDTN